MDHICEYCNKSYKTSSSLNYHQKSAKFCIELQKKSKPDESIAQLFTCEFCNKEYSTKFILNNHIAICTSKVLFDKLEEQKINLEKIYKEEKEELIKEYKELEKKFLLLTQTLEFKDTIIKEKDTYCEKQLKEKDAIIKEKEQFIQENFKELLSKQQAPVYQNTTVNNQHINNYNNYYNKMFNELTPFTNSYLKSKICETITPGSLIYVHNLDNANSNIIDYNFACSLVNILKNCVFFTDTSRGKLVYKDENNEKKLETAETLVLESMQIAKKECLNICKVAIDIVREREQEFTDKDYGQCISGLTQLSDCIKLGKPHAIITEIANKLSKNGKFMPSLKEFKMEQTLT